QVGLGGEGEPGQVLEAAAVLGPHSGLVELLAVLLDVVVGVPQGRAEAVELQLAELLSGQALAVVQQFVRDRPSQPGAPVLRGRRSAAHRDSLVFVPRMLRLRPRNSAITSSSRLPPCPSAERAARGPAPMRRTLTS